MEPISVIAANCALSVRTNHSTGCILPVGARAASISLLIFSFSTGLFHRNNRPTDRRNCTTCSSSIISFLYKWRILDWHHFLRRHGDATQCPHAEHKSHHREPWQENHLIIRSYDAKGHSMANPIFLHCSYQPLTIISLCPLYFCSYVTNKIISLN